MTINLLSAIMAAAMAQPAPANTDAQPFSLPALPYKTDALEPHVDTKTMEIHHGRHHKAYVDNLNGKVVAFPELASLSLEEIMAKVSSFDAGVRNNAGGHYNHSLFWTVMAPEGKGGNPSAELARKIDADFGSFDAFKEKFSQAAATVFGSGWAWLVVGADGKLKVTATPNQDNPLMDVVQDKGTPILALDVWEHAYYLNYQNKRVDYIGAWWKVVNWNEVNKLFAAAS